MRLFLCEKPSQAKDIAAALGATRRGDGCWVGANATVTWCIGHLLETAPPDAYDARYKRWVLADLPIIPDKWKMTVKPRTASLFKDMLSDERSRVRASGLRALAPLHHPRHTRPRQAAQLRYIYACRLEGYSWHHILCRRSRHS